MNYWRDNRCRDEGDLTKHEWGGIIRQCQHCDLIASPETVARAEQDKAIRDEATHAALARVVELLEKQSVAPAVVGMVKEMGPK